MISLLNFKPDADPSVQKRLRSVHILSAICLLALLAIAWASLLGDLPAHLFWPAIAVFMICAGYVESKASKIKESSNQPPED